MNAAKAISESQKMTPVGRGCLIAFGSIFALAGSVFFVLAFVIPVYGHYRARGWPTATATITHSEVKSSWSDDGTTYCPDIHYRYEVNGKTYTSTKYSFYEWSTSNSGWVRKAVRKHAVGTQHECYYDPDDPQHAVLTREFSWFMCLATFPLIFVIVGMAVLWFAFGKEKDKRGTGNRLDQRTSMSTGEPNASAPWLGSEGPRKLKPDQKRWHVFLFMLIFAAIWNGVTCMGVYFTLRDDGIVSFAMLFLSIFILVGLGAIIGVIYQLLAMFNPVVEVAFSNVVVDLGETVDVAWEMSGNANRISELKLDIVGTESATYRRGTDTHTDTQEFIRIPIVTTTDSSEMQFGSTSIEIPGNTMHSLDGPNNKILWTVEVKGDIKWWPDIGDTYCFFVRPPSYHS